MAKTYIHPGSQMAFPDKVAGFHRIEITKYAPDESDVSAGYNSDDPTSLVTATVYVFPAPVIPNLPSETPPAARARQFERALAAVKKEITDAHPGAKLISEAEFVLNQVGRSHKGKKVSYEMAFNDGARPVNSCSDMYLFLSGKWLIEYRISCPKTSAAAAQRAINEFLTALTWDEI